MLNCGLSGCDSLRGVRDPPGRIVPLSLLLPVSCPTLSPFCVFPTSPSLPRARRGGALGQPVTLRAWGRGCAWRPALGPGKRATPAEGQPGLGGGWTGLTTGTPVSPPLPAPPPGALAWNMTFQSLRLETQPLPGLWREAPPPSQVTWVHCYLQLAYDLWQVAATCHWEKEVK